MGISGIMNQATTISVCKRASIGEIDMARNRQRNTPYTLPLKRDITRFYMRCKTKMQFLSWTHRNNHKYT